MRVAVVGAGVSGLSAARALQRGGAEVVVFEATEHLGGRCRTDTIDGYTFDPGATSIVPRGLEVESVMLNELDTSDLVEIALPVYTHDGRRIFLGAGLPPTPRYCYKQGINHFAQLIAEDLDVRFDCHVIDVNEYEGKYEVLGEAYDSVVLATFVDEALKLARSAGVDTHANNTRYRSCLSVLLGFEREFDAPYHAIVAEESVHPMHWLSIENLKVPGRAPKGCTAIVVQMGPKFSKWNFGAKSEDIVNDALVDVERVLGKGFETPVVTEVVRFERSQAETVSRFESVNAHGKHVVIAGDGVEGGRIEHAYASGVKAAKMLLAK
ncbi:MAG TPA: FAD-dependent oxidoreductase [Fimbriimonadaceae bacterium]|nr:FAD-dependent oxidoreductase [Fimbriimonadaceae bacterium]